MGDSSQVGAYSNSTTPSNRVQGPANDTPQSGNGAGMAATGIGAATSAYAQYVAGRYNKQASRVSAALAESQAVQAERAGDFAANRIAAHERLSEGQGRAEAAASGVVVGAGSNRAVQASNQAASSMDQYMTELNARRLAYGYRVHETGDLMQGDMAERSANMGAVSTLLNGGEKMWMESDRTHSTDGPIF